MMTIDGIGPRTLDGPERFNERPLHGARGARGETGSFNVEHASEAEPAGEVDHKLSHSERANQGRRRPAVRMSRRSSERGHGAEEVHSAEASEPSEISDLHLELDPDQDQEGGSEGGQGGEEPGELSEEGRDQATAADFEALSAQLQRLGGTIRELTLYLPSLGRVTARMAAGAISIVLDVPRALLDAVRRGEQELLSRLQRQGLRVSHFQIDTHETQEDEVAAAYSRAAWPRRGLVDVMA